VWVALGSGRVVVPIGGLFVYLSLHGDRSLWSEGYWGLATYGRVL